MCMCVYVCVCIYVFIIYTCLVNKMEKDDLTLLSIGQLNGKVQLQPQFLTVNILS